MSSFTGSFLVARPVLKDENFARTVVLILHHSEAGAYGVVVNRPGRAKLTLPVYLGGPCESPGLVLLHGHSEWVDPEEENDEDSPRQIAPGVFLGDASCLPHIQDTPPGKAFRYRLFKGYSGWGPGQVEQEIAAGAWVVVPAGAELLFDEAPEELWARLSPRVIPEPSLN
jgi:putative transcriptional regulator